MGCGMKVLHVYSLPRSRYLCSSVLAALQRLCEFHGALGRTLYAIQRECSLKIAIVYAPIDIKDRLCIDRYTFVVAVRHHRQT